MRQIVEFGEDAIENLEIFLKSKKICVIKYLGYISETNIKIYSGWPSTKLCA